jgi:hypothetical protein
LEFDTNVDDELDIDEEFAEFEFPRPLDNVSVK